jgi:hypothetical protein
MLADFTGYSKRTIYSALDVLKAIRHHVGRNSYAYSLPTDVPEPIEDLGRIEGKSWRHVAHQVISVAGGIPLSGNVTATQYAEGFETLAERFNLLAEHARAVENRPDWKIVLGLVADTETK